LTESKQVLFIQFNWFEDSQIQRKLIFGNMKILEKKALWGKMGIVVFLVTVILASLSCKKEDTISHNYGSVTDIDGNIYRTIVIGNQEWMADNLRTGKYNDATPIDSPATNGTWASNTTGAYCFYNGNTSNFYNLNGALYNWRAVNRGNLCPTGWRVPTDEDWLVLIDTLGGESVAGGKLKKTGTDYWKTPNNGASNASGFEAVAGGRRMERVSGTSPAYMYINTAAYFWSSTERSAQRGYYYMIGYAGEVILRDWDLKNRGFSVRCVKE
jgi:uncharacterized protein (TIGR02145 family)